jgi:hypothetical protein
MSTIFFSSLHTSTPYCTLLSSIMNRTSSTERSQHEHDYSPTNVPPPAYDFSLEDINPPEYCYGSVFGVSHENSLLLPQFLRAGLSSHEHGKKTSNKAHASTVDNRGNQECIQLPPTTTSGRAYVTPCCHRP